MLVPTLNVRIFYCELQEHVLAKLKVPHELRGILLIIDLQ